MMPGTVVVPLSVPRLLLRLLIGVGALVVGPLLVFGPGPVWTALYTVLGSLFLLIFVVAVVRRRPRVEITPSGFTTCYPTGEQSWKWGDVRGEFAVIRIGWSKAVAFNLTDEYKARAGTKPVPYFSGYDAAISGAFASSAAELAELLNAHARRAAS